MTEKKLGLAGRLARPFIHSKLTPLLLIASILLGVFAVLELPREEEPQIIVPMSDVIVTMPGASAKEVEQRITTPLERILWEIPGVEYLYSTSSPGIATVIVRFKVGRGRGARRGAAAAEARRERRPDPGGRLRSAGQDPLDRRCPGARAHAVELALHRLRATPPRGGAADADRGGRRGR